MPKSITFDERLKIKTSKGEKDNIQVRVYQILSVGGSFSSPGQPSEVLLATAVLPLSDKFINGREFALPLLSGSGVAQPPSCMLRAAARWNLKREEKVVERVPGPMSFTVVRPVDALKRPRMFAPKAKCARLRVGQSLEAEELVKVTGDAAEAPRAYVKVNLSRLQLPGGGGGGGVGGSVTPPTGGEDPAEGSKFNDSDSDAEGETERATGSVSGSVAGSTSSGGSERPGKVSRRFSRCVGGGATAPRPPPP